MYQCWYCVTASPFTPPVHVCSYNVSVWALNAHSTIKKCLCKLCFQDLFPKFTHKKYQDFQQQCQEDMKSVCYFRLGSGQTTKYCSSWLQGSHWFQLAVSCRQQYPYWPFLSCSDSNFLAPSTLQTLCSNLNNDSAEYGQHWKYVTSR